MKFVKRSSVIALLVVAMCAFAAGQSAKAAVEEGAKQFSAALKKGDAAALAAMYSSDAQALPPNGEMVSGREGIQKMWQGVIDSGMKNMSLTTLEVVQSGNLAYEVGKYTLSSVDGQTSDTGKYVVVWKREKGKWKLHRDIWNTNLPAAK